MNHRIQAMIRRFGVSVIAGETWTLGLFDATAQAENITGGDYAAMQVDAPSVLVESAKLPGLKVRDPITVDGRPYLVRSILREDDGAITRLWLLEA